MPNKRRKLSQPPPPRTIQELRAAAYHLRYEIEMLKFTATPLIPVPHPINGDYAVLMESFLIHARNLNEFFYGWEMACEGKKSLLLDDVIAEDFFDAEMPWAKPQTNRLPDNLRQRLNEQLAHLTYGRKSGQYGDWDFSDICQRMSSLMDLFLQVVAPEKVESA